MSLFDIINMIPMEGKATFGSKGSIEDVIDRAFEQSITEAPTIREQGFRQGVYCAYVHMTLNKANWTNIKEFLISAADM